jgi:hypothetical protein
MPLGTVKNALTNLRRRQLVEYTGEVEPHTKAKEVRLTEDGRAVTGATTVYGNRDAVTPGSRQLFAGEGEGDTKPCTGGNDCLCSRCLPV